MTYMRRIFVAVTAFLSVLPYAAFAQTAEQAGSSDMPQLNPAHYASQVFWLILSGLGMYFLMSRYIIPRVSRMIDLRDDQVRLNLEVASRLRNQAEDMKIEYMHVLRDADERAQTVIDRVAREAQKKQDEALGQSADNLAARLVQTQETLSSQKAEVLQDVSTLADRFGTLWLERVTSKTV